MNAHQAQALEVRRRGRETPRPRRPGVLGIVSGKGGVGKSLLAVNLASAAARGGARTLLIDGDAGLANADLLLGLTPPFDLDDWTAAGRSLEEVVCRGPHGLSLLVAGSRGESRRRLARALAGLPAEGLEGLVEAHDVTFLDLGAGIDEHVLAPARACGLVWLVATPEPTSLADAYTTLKRLGEGDTTAAVELVVNRAPSRDSAERTHQALSRLCERFLGRSIALRGVVPEEPELLRSVARQAPLVLEPRPCAASRRLELLAESLLEQLRVGDPLGPPLPSGR